VDPAQLLGTSRLVIVAGKGGVGKTTVSAAMARAAARLGMETLLVEVEGKTGLAESFGAKPLDYDEAVLAKGGRQGTADVRGRHITPDDALLEYLEDHGLRRVSKRLAESGALEVVSTAVPGIKDILVLGKVKQLERAGDADLILLDAPAAGHAISFLHSARGLVDAVKVGPINAQARDVLEMLTDPERCRVILVTLPEETPVNELVETAYRLEDRVGVSLGPIVVNGLYPLIGGLDRDPTEAAEEAGVVLRPGEADMLAEAARFRRCRRVVQDEQVARLSEKLPLPQIHLPYMFSGRIGPAELELLADAFIAGVEKLDAVA
jgi:anion-transporting  ArsA/GET3 family ATPase